MKVLVTGSAGRVGRATYVKLMRTHDVVGFDKIPCSTADYIGDIRDTELVKQALSGSRCYYSYRCFTCASCWLTDGR